MIGQLFDCVIRSVGPTLHSLYTYTVPHALVADPVPGALLVRLDRARAEALRVARQHALSAVVHLTVSNLYHSAEFQPTIHLHTHTHLLGRVGRVLLGLLQVRHHARQQRGVVPRDDLPCHAIQKDRTDASVPVQIDWSCKEEKKLYRVLTDLDAGPRAAVPQLLRFHRLQGRGLRRRLPHDEAAVLAGLEEAGVVTGGCCRCGSDGVLV